VAVVVQKNWNNARLLILFISNNIRIEVAIMQKYSDIELTKIERDTLSSLKDQPLSIAQINHQDPKLSVNLVKMLLEKQLITIDKGMAYLTDFGRLRLRYHSEQTLNYCYDLMLKAALFPIYILGINFILNHFIK
jgi:hypothetical protein